METRRPRCVVLGERGGGNEGHGFHNQDAPINYYRHLEAFLDKYLAPAAQPEGSAPAP